MSFDESPLPPEVQVRGAASSTRGAVARREAAAPSVHAAPAPVLRSAAELPLGASAVLGQPDRLDATVLRLLEMGLTPGTRLALTRRAPGGDPIEVRVRGTRLCVRRADLARFPVGDVVLAPPKRRSGT